LVHGLESLVVARIRSTEEPLKLKRPPWGIDGLAECPDALERGIKLLTPFLQPALK